MLFTLLKVNRSLGTAHPYGTCEPRSAWSLKEKRIAPASITFAPRARLGQRSSQNLAPSLPARNLPLLPRAQPRSSPKAPQLRVREGPDPGPAAKPVPSRSSLGWGGIALPLISGGMNAQLPLTPRFRGFPSRIPREKKRQPTPTRSFLTGVIHGTAVPGLRARPAARPRPSPPVRSRGCPGSFLQPAAAPGRRSRPPPTAARGGLRDGAHGRELLSGGNPPSAAAEAAGESLGAAAPASRLGAGGGKAPSRSGAHLRGKEEGKEQEPQAEPRRQRRPHAHLMLSRHDAGAAPAAVAAGERDAPLRRARPLL